MSRHWWCRKKYWERDLDDELRFHLEHLIQDYIEQGLSPAAALRRAYREFGAVELAKEECRDQWPLHWAGDLVEDLRYAARIFTRTPVFTIIAVLTLALGIGANTAMFTLVHRVLLKTLPVTDPEELVEISCVNTNEPDKMGCQTSYPGFLMYRENQVLSGLFAFASTSPLNAVSNGEAELVTGLLATGDMYNVLGVTPAFGRLINPSDDLPSSPLVAVLSHAYWQRRFGGDPRVIGQVLRLNTNPVTIAGVTAASFRGVTLGVIPDVTLPMGSGAVVFNGKGSLENGGNWWLRVIGRRKKDVSLRQAQAGLEPIYQRTVEHLMSSIPADLASRVRGYLSGVHFKVQPAAAGASSVFRRDLDRPVRILMGVVCLVLLIACANLTSLLLSRASARQREFGVRIAIGAGRLRLVRQLLTESLLLTTIGSVLGLAIAQWGGALILRMTTGDAGLQAIDLKPDVPVLLFTAAVAALTGLLLGFGPVLHLARTNPQGALRDLRRKWMSSRLARVLVPAQVALAVVILIGAGLLLRTFDNFLHIDLGFRSEKLITFRVGPGLVGYGGARSSSYLRDLTARLEALPGVRSVTLSSEPLGALNGSSLVDVPGFESAATMERVAGRGWVGAKFIETAGMRLLRGRDFSASETNGARIAIVNESFARHFFKRMDVIDRQFTFVGGKDQPYRIVGVVADALDRGPKNPVERVAYTRLEPQTFSQTAVALRVEGSETALMGSVRSVLRQVDAGVPVIGPIETMEGRVEEALRRERLLAVLGMVFGGLALLLAGIGLYGLLAGAVARRTHEIGIRMALGARRLSVLWLVLREGMVLIAIGLVAGVGVGLLMTRFIRSQLFGVTPMDPVSFVCAVGVLVVVAMAAALLPARRASRIDPLLALRYE